MSIHHMTNTRLFNVWQNIKRRCYTKTNPSYKYYGACGIKVCKEWRENFISFYTWAMDNGYDENAPKGVCTLDRIDINGDYEPNNCRWVDIKTQSNNTSCNVKLTANGETMTIAQWARKLSVNDRTLQSRHRKGMSDEEIINKPIGKYTKTNRR